MIVSLKTLNYKLIGCFLIFCLLMSSCGTTTRGCMQQVTITSTPSEATIIVDNKACGKTPQIVSMSRNKKHHIMLMKEGFQPEYYLLKPQASPILAGNLGYGAAIAGVGITAGLIANHPLVFLVFASAGIAVGTVVTIGGVGTDLISGAGFELSAEYIHAPLQPIYQN